MPDTLPTSLPLERPDTTPIVPGWPAPGAWETLVRLWNRLRHLRNDLDAARNDLDAMVMPGTVWTVYCGLGGSDGKRPIPLGSDTANEQWALCDGSNGTPDLRGRVIIGAGGAFALGDRGGATTHTHEVAGSVAPTTLDQNTVPYHYHTMSGTRLKDGDDRTFTGLQGDSNNMSPATNAVGGSSGHGHDIAVTSAPASSLPPYLALHPVMRLP